MYDCGETIEIEFSECLLHPGGCCFGRESLAPERLCKTISEVDPSIAMQKLETALNDTQTAQFRHKRGHVMVRPDALQLSLLDGITRNLAEREGFEPSVQVLARTTV